MKHAARYQACIEILAKIQSRSLPMDLVVGDYMRNRRYIGSTDRAFIAETVYNVIRHYGRINWCCEQINAKADARILLAVFLLVFDSQELPEIETVYNGTRYAPEELSESEKKILLSIADRQISFEQDMPSHVKTECPVLYKDRLKNRFGPDFEREMKAFINPAPLDLRVNIATMDREKTALSLQKDGVKTTPTPYSPWGLRCLEKAYLGKTNAYRNGEVEIQDEGSQLIAYLAGAEPGMQVLDYCAGGGGKTLAMAAAMGGKGRLVAMDIDGRRLKKANQRLKRAGCRDIIEIRPLDEKRHARWLKRQTGKFDVVLVDVPCSGTGTWRRNPDSRWFQYGPDLEDLTAIQSEILENVCHTVKPGGRLVYATCSILQEENDDRIAAFLKTRPEFEIVPAETLWPVAAKTPDIFKGENFMKLTPLRAGTDGFFAAVLEKRLDA